MRTFWECKKRKSEHINNNNNCVTKTKKTRKRKKNVYKGDCDNEYLVSPFRHLLNFNTFEVLLYECKVFFSLLILRKFVLFTCHFLFVFIVIYLFALFTILEACAHTHTSTNVTACVRTLLPK